MSAAQAKSVELDVAEVDDLTARLDDGFLISRIKNVGVGDVHPDPEGETTEVAASLTWDTTIWAD